eukprot:TRINITY_DN37930_c0_g2_i2.p1 TRINITY_DN37930_c0_g2~~TRINITY_DN37930_c0_g2_i2.p1  ORF type:complete len:284 (+),score=117.02 TRINITY_DN37930_c0_g2_i2:64-915(+)
MPPRKYKTDHRRGGGGGAKHVSSIADVEARNRGEESAYDRARRERAGGGGGGGPKKQEDEESEEESSEEEEPKQTKQIGQVVKDKGGEGASGGYPATANPNAIRHVDKEGVELTRKQREELEKQAAQRRYQELHKAGKTDEAKADLARLAEVKARREAAAKAKAEAESAASGKTKVEEAKAIGRAALTKELKSAMGTEGERVRGKKKGSKDEKDKDDKDEKDEEEDGVAFEEEKPKTKKINGVDESNMYSFVSDVKKVKEEGSRFKATDGTIEACRAAEEDFM